jgi:hypothetical protein
VGEQRQESERRLVAQGPPAIGLDGDPRIIGANDDTVVAPGSDAYAGAEADSRVDRRGMSPAVPRYRDVRRMP